MMKTNNLNEGLRSYAQPSLRYFNIGLGKPVCLSGGATTEDYTEDDVFGGGNN